MKKAFTLLLGLAAMSIAPTSAMAEDFYVKIDHNNPDISIVQGSGKFDYTNLLLGNASGDLVIDLGEVDFDNGYKGAYVDVANGWENNVDGVVILSAGQDLASATPFAKIPFKHFYTYYLPRRYGQNFGRDITGFTAPTGKQHVYASYEEGKSNCNFFGVGFVQNAYTYDDYVNSNYTKPFDQVYTTDADKDIRILWPNEDSRYADKSIVVNGSAFYNVNDPGQTTDAGKIDGDGSIGWTGNNLTMKSKETVDFGANRFGQIVIQTKMSTWGASVNINKFLEVYIDEVADENKIGRVWYGMEAWRDNTYVPLVCNLEKEVSGAHSLIIKWGEEGSCNVMNVGLYEGTVWPVTQIPDPSLYPVDHQPIDDALVFNFVQGDGNSRSDVPGDGNSKIYNNDWKCTVLKDGQWEDHNVGYTKNGTILRISAADGSGYDFGTAPYDHIVARYSTGDGNYRGTIDESHFKFYVDLEKDGAIDWDNNDAVNATLEQEEHTGIVRMQATGGWGTVYGLRGDVTKPENLNGQHTLYIVYKSNDGANIKSLHFERAAEVAAELTDFAASADEITKTSANIVATYTVANAKETTKAGIAYRVTGTEEWTNVEGTLEGATIELADLTPNTEYSYDVYATLDGEQAAEPVTVTFTTLPDPTITLGEEPEVSVVDHIATVTVAYTVSDDLVGKEIIITVNGEANATFTPEAAEGTVDVIIEEEDVDEAGRTYTIGFEAEGMESPAVVEVFIKLSGIDTVEADADSVRYINLKGYEVTNPAAGEIYLKVDGNKTTKVLVK